MNRPTSILRAALIVTILSISLAAVPYLGLPYRPLEATALLLGSSLYHDDCFDFDSSGLVDSNDIAIVAVRWPLDDLNPDPDNDPTTPNYEFLYDINHNGRIDMEDIMLVAADWGDDCS